MLNHMYLIVGLGNPGKQYEQTRHNAGFMALDKLATQHSFPDFTLSKKHSALVSEGTINQAEVVLAKPQTFMNNSGKAVAALVRLSFRLSFRKLSLTKELIVVHDDIDIPLGEVKISKGRGSAGHKGVESIIQALGTKNFTRVRIGIQPQRGKPKNVESFVLKKFAPNEKLLIKKAIQESSHRILEILE